MYKVTVGRHLWELDNLNYIEAYHNTYEEVELFAKAMLICGFDVMIEHSDSFKKECKQ